MKISRISRGRWAAATLLGALALHPLCMPAAGPLTPPGAPAPMWKSLQEIEPRTLIASVPYTITTPGSYYLSNNLTVGTGDAITIAASGVTLDLNGFTLSSAAPSATGYAITIYGGVRDVTILNGHIVSGVYDNGNGSFSGPGFGYGIFGSSALNVRVRDVSVSGCLYNGIYLSPYGGAVSDCAVSFAGNYGIYAGEVTRCIAYGCGTLGIGGAQVSDSWGSCPYAGNGISGQTVLNCYGYSKDSAGINASTAGNCYGESWNYIGLWANSASSCFGYSSTTNSSGVVGDDLRGCYGQGGYAGINAYGTASGCYGYSYYGDGIFAYAADNCYGQSLVNYSNNYAYAGIRATAAHNCYGYSYNTSAGNYDQGLAAATANNCYGRAYNGTGLTCWGTAENCYGSSSFGYGLYAETASNCHGESQNNLGLLATTANNCYGSGQSADGLSASTANNCYGYSYNGYYGLYAQCANNSYGYSYTGTGASGGAGLYAIRSANNCCGYCNRPSSDGLNAYLAIGCYGLNSGPSGYGLSANIANSCAGSGALNVNAPNKYNMP